MTSYRIACGETEAGGTAWVQYNPPDNSGVYVDVDTSSGHFTSTPVYVTSLGGEYGNWSTTGGTSIYATTPTGFRVYIRSTEQSTITPEQANHYLWHIHWIGMEV